MKDRDKTKEQLIKGLNKLQKRINNLERLEAKQTHIEEALKESEERLRLVVENTEDVIIMQDPNGKYIYCNSPPKYGLKAEDVIGKTPFDLHEPKMATKYIKRIKQVAKTGQSMVMETQLNWKGEPMWFFDLISPIKDDDGNVKALVTVCRNITKLKVVEKALRESENYYRDLADSITDIFFAMDKDLKYTFWNKASEKLTGISSKDAIGKTIFEVFSDNEETRRAIKVYKEVIKTKIPQTFINEYHIKGKKYFFGINAYPSSRGGLSIFVKDITKQKNAEEALRKSEERFHSLFENSPIPLCECDVSKVRKYLDDLQITGGENLRAYFRAHPDEVNNCILKNRINNVNKAALELFRIRSKKDFKKGLIKFFAFGSNKGIIEAIVAFYKGEKSFNIETVTQTKNGEKIHILLKGILVPGYEKKMKKILVTIIDLTEQKRREEEIKKGMMKFNLEEGNIYLIPEQTSSLSIEVFSDVLNAGYSGLAISRTTANKFKNLLRHDFKFVWLADMKKDGESTLKPDTKKLKQFIENQPKKFAILIDRVDYIMSKNGFKKTLNFIHFLKEIAYYNEQIIIISIDPITLNSNELRQLEKESSTIETRERVRLPLEQLDILIFIIKQNLIGIRPKYSQIEKELGISKPTVRKRIEMLMSNGYVTISPRGNTKVVEATEKGKRFF